MRYVLTETEPTAEQLADSNAQMLSGATVGISGFIVAVEGDDLPAWLEGTELNIPGEIHRCPHCGEPDH